MYITYIILSICVTFCFVIFFYFKWYIKRHISVSALSDEYRIEIERLKADLNAITDRNVRLAEETIKKLKELMDSADKRINVYVADGEGGRVGGSLYTSLGHGIRAALKTEDEPLAAQTAKEVKPHPSLQSHPAIRLSLEPRSAPEALPEKKPQETANETPSAPPSKRQIRAYIDILVNDGLTPAEIAERLGISLAEVNLAMNLRRTRR